jgi:hypothetical protein
MKNSVLLLTGLALLIALAMPLAAQEADNFDLLEMESSMFMGYDFANNTVDQASRFGVTFNISESLDAGVLFQQAGLGTAVASYLRLKYYLADRVGVSVLYGLNGGNSSAGVQVGYDLLTNNVQAISTSLSINLEYLVPNIASGIETGTAGASLVLGFGI